MSHEHVMIEVVDGGRRGGELVPARRLDEGRWELLRSPLYAMSVASGDVVRVSEPDTGKFEIVKRGGNVCVQFYLSEADDADATSRVAKGLEALLRPLGGRVDATTAGLVSCTVPVSVGFPAIEQVFRRATDQATGAQWQYANVYDSDSGEPLGWWNETAG